MSTVPTETPVFGSDAHKGLKNLNRGGRPKGSTNLAKRNAREAIKLLVEKNISKVQKWLDTIEKEQGAQAAYRCLLDLFEYAVPKLSRAEVTGMEDGPIELVVRWQGATPEANVVVNVTPSAADPISNF